MTRTASALSVKFAGVAGLFGYPGEEEEEMRRLDVSPTEDSVLLKIPRFMALIIRKKIRSHILFLPLPSGKLVFPQ
ncbi:hypothetical protein HYQ44_011389 [Verticillium longisporum]|nr:hypothetical protein HYQ44_011389 [Verticillium longisporum]